MFKKLKERVQIWMYLRQVKILLPLMERFRLEKIKEGKSTEILDRAIEANKKLLKEQRWKI